MRHDAWRKGFGVEKSSSDAGSKKQARKQVRLSMNAGAMLCKGTRSKPIGDSFDCRQVLGVVGESGVSIKCRRCKSVEFFEWKRLKQLRDAVLEEKEKK